MSQRLFQLDLARATAIALVTAYHLWRFFDAPAIWVGPFDLAGVAAMGFTGVDLFFVVSGYAVSLTWCRMGHGRVLAFWATRFLRIYPPYAAAIGVWCAVMAAGYVVRPAGPTDILTHLTFTHTLQAKTFFSVSGVFWSLAVEAHFYLLFPVLVLLRWRGLGAMSAASLLFSAAVLLLQADRQAPGVYVASWNLATFLPLFLLGMALQRSRQRSRRAGLVALGVALLLMTGLPRYLDVASGGPHLLDRLAVGALLGFGILNAAPSCPPASRVAPAITTIAIASYSIYLYNYAFYLLPRPPFSAAIGFPLYVLFVLAAGIMMWALVERPCEWVRRIVVAAIHRQAASRLSVR
ncbi:MAG TPA: acyltransferase [Hyphomicrobiaceae bacterium]|nr:acyltransferase [Hyphomicrobiaceae bacterium]